jgi:hypothetical protein
MSMSFDKKNDVNEKVVIIEENQSPKVCPTGVDKNFSPVSYCIS